MTIRNLLSHIQDLVDTGISLDTELAFENYQFDVYSVCGARYDDELDELVLLDDLLSEADMVTEN